MLVEPDNQLGGHESRRHVAPHDLCDLLPKLQQEIGRPQPVAEELGDTLALGVMLMFGDRLALERFAVEIAAPHESAIVFDIVPVEAEEGLLAWP